MVNTIEKLELQKNPGKSKPVYRQLVEQLRKNIVTRKLRPGEYLPPIPQLVKTWGIGYSTIHNAMGLLEKEGLINCKTEWGKGPIILEVSNKKKISNVVFVRWGSFTQFLSIEDGIRNYSSRYAGDIEINTIDVCEDMSMYIDTIKHAAGHADGIILYPWDNEDFIDATSKLIQDGIKVVFVDRTVTGIDASCVSIDHFRGSYQATQHLIETHHMPAFYFGRTSGPSAILQRYRGYVEAMHEYGYNDHLKYVFSFVEPEFQQVAQFKNHDNDTSLVGSLAIDAEEFLKTNFSGKLCVFCINDDAALAVYRTAEKSGLIIGRDVFIIGFGDKPYCITLPVPLSSVAQFDERTGFEAAKILHQKITGSQKRRDNIVLPPELRIRQSSTGLNTSNI